MIETKEQRLQNIYSKLVNNLEELVKVYRTLLDLVRKEKNFLIETDYINLNENNQTKESHILKLKSLDLTREKYAKELAHLLGGDMEFPRLLDLAQLMDGPAGDRLRSLHSTLELILKRLMELNKENEIYVKLALETLNGAMNEMKETLVGKQTYARKGKMTLGPEKSGNLVSKEA